MIFINIVLDSIIIIIIISIIIIITPSPSWNEVLPAGMC